MKAKKQTENRFLNMYETDLTYRNGARGKYFFASRAEDEALLKANAGERADGVDIVALYEGTLVLVKQWRAPIDGYIYECPAGLVDGEESVYEAAVREMKEETGLTFTPVPSPEGWDRAFYTSVGMSDEACATVYGYADGSVSADYLEPSERIQVILADKAEAERILRCERLSIRCAHVLMQFVRGTLEKEHFIG